MTTTSFRMSDRLRAAGPVAVAVAVLTAAVVGICGVNSLRAVGTTFPGFFVWENLFVPAAGAPGWTGTTAGLPYHSWIESADGVPVANAEDLWRVIGEAKPGDVVRYVAVKDGIAHEVAVPMMRFELGAYLASTGTFLINALALLALGLTMLYLRPGDEGAHAVFYFCAAQASFLSASIDLFGPYWFRPLYFFFSGSTPLATLFMLSRFPVERRRRRWEDPVLVAGAVCVLAFGLGSAWSFWNRHQTLLSLDAWCHAAMAASAAAELVFFAFHFVNAETYAVRQRTKVVLFASLAAFTPTMVFLVAFYSGTFAVPFNFLAVPFMLFPIGIGYAVAKHDLFDVDRVIKRTLVYTALSAVVLGAYALGIGVFDWTFENANVAVSRLAEGVLIVTLILVTGPSRRRIQDFVDRVYDRRHYDYREVVPRAARAFTTMLEMERLVPAALELIDQTIQPERVALYSLDASGAPELTGMLSHAAGLPAKLEVPRLAEAYPELACVARALGTAEVFDRESPPEDNEEAREAAGALQHAGMRMAAAMPLESRLVGMILIGARRAGSDLTGEDVALLRTIADQLAVALANARSYKTIDVLNRDLEDKNVALASANDDLRAAQLELVAKERLAAVGEIAGAVAHTIRNPLAGMRATAQLAATELEGHATRELVVDFVVETDRLNERIGALLDFARPFDPDVREITLEEIAASAVHAVRGKADQHSVRIQRRSPETPTTVRVDPELFEQLTVELLSNAVDAAGLEGSVVIETGNGAGNTAWMEVRDSGDGVSESAREDLFRLFFSTKKGGTGFGLATVKKIVERHRGSIEVGTAPEGGACFRVQLK